MCVLVFIDECKYVFVCVCVNVNMCLCVSWEMGVQREEEECMIRWCTLQPGQTLNLICRQA